MIRNLAASLLIAGTALTGGWAAAQSPAPLYTRLAAKYPAPALSAVHSTELKFLVDGDKVKGAPEAALVQLWTKIQAAGSGGGFTFSEKWDMPYRVSSSYQEYFDTPDQQLWGKGYLIRVIKHLSAVGKKHKPPSSDLEVTFKSILPDFNAVLAAPLQVAGAQMTKGKAEENIGAGPRRTLSSYIEKTATLVVPPGQLGDLTLGDFARLLPELASLGIPAGTKLQGTRAYTVEMDPGTVQLAGSEPSRIRLEGWSAKPGEKPYLYNVSVKYGLEDFYGSVQLHAAGERFLAKALQEGLADVALADEGKWCGSSVRKLMNRPMAQ
jgi:hypothetical protein